MRRYHLYMRLVVHVAADAKVCVIVGIRMDYNWFPRCVAIRIGAASSNTNFVLSPFCFLHLLSLFLNPLIQCVTEAEKAATSDDGADYNSDFRVSANIIASITIAVTVASVFTTAATTGAGRAATSFKITPFFDQPMLIFLILEIFQ